MTHLFRNLVAVGVAFAVTFVLLFEGMPSLVGIPGLVVIAFLAVWWGFIWKSSRSRSPFQMAFTATAAAAFFVLAGTTGYTLGRYERIDNGTAWADGVIWWQVGVGLALLPFAVYFWRKSLRSLGSNSQAGLSN